MITWPCWVRPSVRQEILPEQAPFLHAQEREEGARIPQSLAGELNSNLRSSTKPHFLKAYPTARSATPGMRALQSDEHVVGSQHQDHSCYPCAFIFLQALDSLS